MSKNWPNFIIILAFIISSAISFYHFGNFSLDLDEIFTIRYAQEINSVKFWEYFDRDLGNPPLFFFLLSQWIKISLAEPWLRLLPFLFWALSIFYSNKLMTSIKISPAIRSIALMMMMGVGAYSYLSVYVRAYSLLLLISILTIYFTTQLIQNGFKMAGFTKLVFTIVAGFYTHYVYWVFLAFWGLVSLASVIKNGQVKSIFPIIAAVVSSVLLSIQIIWHLLSREMLSEGRYYWWQIEGEHNPLSNLWALILKIDHHSLTVTTNEIFGLIFWTTFMIIAYWGYKKSSSHGHTSLIAFSMVFWPVYMTTPLKEYLSQHKYTALFMYIFFISLACIWENQQQIKTKLKNNPIFFFIALTTIVWLIEPSPHKVQGGDDWKTMTSLAQGEYSNYAIITNCLEKDGFDYYSNYKLIVYQSRSLEWSDCEMPSIDEYKEKFDQILVVSDVKTPIGEIAATHTLVNTDDSYHPIFLSFYQRNQETGIDQ